MRNVSLDGFRAVAVFMVLAHHHNYLGTGWMGVDLFFVLSGYLITNVLRQSRTDTYYWQEFWIKRVTRIMPAAVLLLFAAVLLRLPVSMGLISGYLLSFGDVLMFHKPVVEPVAAFWSLAIEEHFYLLWPFAVRGLSRKSLIYCLCGMLIGEPVLRAAVSMFTHNWEVFYFLTPFRLDGLSLGCLLAISMESERAQALITRWSGVGIAGSLACFAALKLALGKDFSRSSSSMVYSASIYSIVGMCAVCILAFILTHPKSSVARLLSWRPLVFTGTVSYGIYLFQVIVRDTVVSLHPMSYRAALWIDVPVTLAISWLSFHFYEQPILEWGKRVAAKLRAQSALTGRGFTGWTGSTGLTGLPGLTGRTGRIGKIGL